jgi:hypothetical protein
MSKLGLWLCALYALGATAAVAPANARAEQLLTPQAAVVGYCDAWNTTDIVVRTRLLERVWAADGVYSDPTAFDVGRAALSEEIATFQKHHPGNRFRCSAAQAHHRYMRVSWILFAPHGNQLAQGMDFYEMARDGRISQLVGFFGPPPAP